MINNRLNHFQGNANPCLTYLKNILDLLLCFTETASSKKPKLNREHEVRKKHSSRQSSCNSNFSTPHGSPFLEQSPLSQSPAPSQMSPMYPTQSPYQLSSPAQSVPSPAFNIQTKTSHGDIDISVPCADEDDKSRLPIFLKDQFTTSSSFEKDVVCIPDTRAVHGTNDAIQNFDAMELSFENESSCNATNELLPQEVIIVNSLSTDDGGINCGNESMICVQQSQNRLSDTSRNTESFVELRVIKNNEGGFSISPGHEHLIDRQPSASESLDVSCLAPDQRKQVEAFVEQLRRNNEMTSSENAIVTSADTSICDIPVSTSSGSSGDLHDYR